MQYKFLQRVGWKSWAESQDSESDSTGRFPVKSETHRRLWNMIPGNRIMAFQNSNPLFSGSCEYVTLKEMRFCNCDQVKDFDRDVIPDYLPLFLCLLLFFWDRGVWTLLGLTLSSESGRDAKKEYSRRQREELMERGQEGENERENLVLSYTYHKHGVSKYKRGF